MSGKNKHGGMGAAGYITIFVVVIYLGFEVYGLQHARERMEPSAVYREYTGARRAAQLCEPEPPSRVAFERNFTAVTELALADIAEQQPDADPAAIKGMLAERQREREMEIDALIESAGCDSKEAWRLMKLYEIRSRLNLRPRQTGVGA